MRTTLVIDDDLYQVAKSLADSRSVSIGRALSDLARRGLDAAPRVKTNDEDDMPVFQVPANAPRITLEDVKKLEDEW